MGTSLAEQAYQFRALVVSPSSPDRLMSECTPRQGNTYRWPGASPQRFTTTVEMDTVRYILRHAMNNYALEADTHDGRCKGGRRGATRHRMVT